MNKEYLVVVADRFRDSASEKSTGELEEILADYKSGFYARKRFFASAESDAEAKELSDVHIAVLEEIIGEDREKYGVAGYPGEAE